MNRINNEIYTLCIIQWIELTIIIIQCVLQPLVYTVRVLLKLLSNRSDIFLTNSVLIILNSKLYLFFPRRIYTSSGCHNSSSSRTIRLCAERSTSRKIAFPLAISTASLSRRRRGLHCHSTDFIYQLLDTHTQKNAKELVPL